MTQAANAMTKESPLFDSVTKALAFAFNYVVNPPSAHARLMEDAGSCAPKASVRPGRGLVGLDAAGQAGMMLAEVQNLPGVSPVMLRLRFGSCEDRSPGCMEKLPCMEWTNALGMLTRSIEARLVRDPMLRRFIVAQLVRGVPVSKITEYEPIAKACDRAPRTLRRHIAELRDQLRVWEEDAISAAEVRFSELGWL